MFKQLHIRLTLFCTLISGLILVLMSLICISFSEAEARESYFSNFELKATMLIHQIESRSVLSLEWFSQLKADTKFEMDIHDNGVKLLLEDLSPQRLDAKIPKNRRILNIAILQPLTELSHSISFRRFLFAGADILGIFLLGIFFWFYTKRMIRPLIENRQKQTEFIAAASHELRSPLALMLSACEKFEPLAMKKNISLDFSLPDTLSAPYPCDKERIEQVLSILLDNALSYTPENGRICLSMAEASGRITIRVADNGPGIPDSEKKSIFERFYRCDKAHKDKKHFGLGLCIAQEIIHMHKGKIWVEDTPGGGATFVVMISV